MALEISVEELAAKLKTAEGFIVLDVREPWEVTLASLADARLMVSPMSELSRRGLSALPEAALQKEQPIYVICHLGVRSAQVTQWLASKGWPNVLSVTGGIDEYARKIDPTVGLY